MLDSETKEKIKRAAELIEGSDAVIIAAGAGMGVDSGLPDFRGTDGFWRAYPALARAGIDFYAAASPDTFSESPRRAWGFYGHRLSLYRTTLPHDGFALLKKWGQNRPHGYSVFTSNVDGHFEKAGFDPLRIHECHGSIHYLQCTQPCRPDLWPAKEFEPVVDEKVCELRNDLPRCPRCSGIARPNILMFYDHAWVEERTLVQEISQQEWLSQIRRPVVIEIGAGKAVTTVRNFSMRISRHHNSRLIRINPREPEVHSSKDVGLALGAYEALSAIDALIVGSNRFI